MKEFIFEGINAKGETVSGKLESKNRAMAQDLLRKQSIFILKLQSGPLTIFSRIASIQSREITVFTRQLATVLTTGIPLVQALLIIANGSIKKNTGKLIGSLKTDVESGLPFSQSLGKHPSLFNDLYCNLIAAAEQIGALDKMLERLANYREKSDALKSKIKKALVYPLSIVFTAILVTAVILIFVIPQFESMFQNFGATLPPVTRLVVSLSRFMQRNWYVLLIVPPISGYCIRTLYQNYKPFRHGLEKSALKMPLFGNLLIKASVARFARTLATVVNAGVPVAEGLNSLSKATGNIVFEQATGHIQQRILDGITFHKAIRECPIFPYMLGQMVMIGEETGELPQMLNKVADYYGEEVDNMVNSISILLEPLLMLILGVMIGGLIVAMYLPIFQMGTIV